MALTARDVMTADVRSVGPEMMLSDLERRLIEEKLSGFPVVENGRLVGIVSRSDVVRQLYVERTVAESVSDFYIDAGGFQAEATESFESIGRRVGARVEGLCVKDVMIHELVKVGPEATLGEVASTLLQHRIHRVPVVDGGRLVGIVSSLDLARLFAEGRVAPV